MIKVAKHFSHVGALIAVSTLVGCGGGAETKTDPTPINPQAPVSDWQLVWSDEFDGTSIDGQKWTHEVNCLGGGNAEKQCYTEDEANSYVSDGTLKIVALPAAEGAQQPYTSARMITKNKADFKYGRFEMRAKLPSGQGSWPAFWLLPTDEVYGGWPKSGEIDIVEAVNLKAKDAEGNPESHVYGTLHYGKDWPDNVNSGKAYKLPDGANPADDFHTYAIEWQEGEIRWYVDDYLYATQRRSEIRTNSKGETVGLKHRGWFAEYFDQVSGELTTHYSNAPYDQEFHMLLNFAVGGNWPENVNETGVDASAFENGQTFEIDFVRVYQCQQNVDTGKGCETVRAGYDSIDDALVEGKAPIPSPPSTGVAQNLTIFDGSFNPNWPAWDCCGGSTPLVVEDEMKGNVVEFVVGAEPTVNGFITREAFITDEAGKPSPFDASPMIETGKLSFDMKIVTAPNNADSTWMLKLESSEGTTAIEIPLSQNISGTEPVVGQWQTFEFSLQALADGGLDLSAIDVVMIFPAWGTGEGAQYRIANLKIEDSGTAASPKLTIFENDQNPSWPLWDCCGGSTPTVELDDDSHGNVAEFKIGDSPTVMGFISRADNILDGGSVSPFDATSILSNGVIEFEMKITNAPDNAEAPWLFKVESVDAASFAEVDLSTSVEQTAPVVGEWQKYTFKLSDLANAGLDVSAIDVLMIFPAWGQGAGAIYRVDNVKIYDPNASDAFMGHVLFADDVKEKWSLWDCCGGSTPTIENDDTAHGMTAEFKVGAEPTVLGLFAEDEHFIDASALFETGVVQFELKVVTAPNNADAEWLFKIESLGASSFAQLALSASQEGKAPVVGEWQTYTYSLKDLSDAGLDISAIDILMFFPAWGAGEGAVYRVDNVMIKAL